MARQYTTPTVTLTVVGHDLTGADSVRVTFSNKLRNIVLTISNPTVAASGDDSTVSVHLTQTQTAMFHAGEEVDIQVNWMASGERYATEIASEIWNENLLKEVLV